MVWNLYIGLYVIIISHTNALHKCFGKKVKAQKKNKVNSREIAFYGQ